MIEYLSLIKEALKENEEARDDDELLAELVYKKISPNLLTMSWIAISFRVRAKKIPSIPTIARLARQLRKNNPELQGKRYQERLTHKVSKARKDLNYE